MLRTWCLVLASLCACGHSSRAGGDAPATTTDSTSGDAARDGHAGSDAGDVHDGGALAACTPTSGHTAVVDVQTGTTSCALYANGHIACWGEGEWGALGDGVATHSSCSTVDCSLAPVAVSGIADAIAIGVGGGDACALHAGGTVSCWGDGIGGELGDGVAKHATMCTASDDCSRVPVTVTGLNDAVAISVGEVDACAVRSGGTVVCWGLNEEHQLGDGSATHDSCDVGVAGPIDCSREPVTVASLGDAVSVSVGDGFACAQRVGGGVACWGDNALGSLGNGTITNSTTPVAVSDVTDAVATRSGFGGACALRTNHTVTCWGYDDAGMLGDGAVTHQACTGANDCSPTPVTVTGLADATVFDGRWEDGCAVRATGAVVCWGDDQFSELGTGATAPATCAGGGPCSKSPVTVVGVTSPVAISAGSFSSCAVGADCSVACWGFNTYGELGDGTTTNRGTAVRVVGL